MFNNFFCSFYLLISAYGGLMHGVYLSVTEVEIDEQGAVQIVLKVFSDDLFNSMKNQNSNIVSLESALVRDEVRIYFEENLQLKSDQNLLTLSLEEISEVGESTIIIFGASMSPESNGIEVGLHHFFELFPSQRNILKLKYLGRQEHAIFTASHQKRAFRFH